MSHRRSALSLFLCSLILVLAPSLAGAQATTTGNLAGTVTDPSGAVVPNATLTIENPAVGSKETQTSDSRGAYNFADLQVGHYRLTVEASGFSRLVVPDVIIDTGRSADINPKLVAGGANETVSVTSDVQVLETTTNTLAATIRPDAVQDLPLSGRDSSPLTQLAPGAQTTGDARYGTFNGLPTGAINITIDGMNSNFQKFRSASSGNFSPAPARLGAIEEVSVSTGDLTADSGAEGSVAIRFQIKRGTNKWHGSAFWEYTSSALNANSYLNDAKNAQKNKTHTNDEGGSISGPIWKDKLFLFVNYEQQIINGKTQATSSLLTQAAQAGNISYTYTNPNNKSDPMNGSVIPVNVLQVLGGLTNPQTGGPFPSAVNSFVASQLSSVNQYSSNALINATALPYQNSATWSYGTTTYNIYPTTRLDWQITPKMDFHAAYDLQWRKLPGTQIYDGDPIYNNNFKSSYQTISAGFDWTITSHIVNQINFGILNDQEHYSYDNPYDLYASLGHTYFSAPTFTNGSAVLAETTPNAQTEPRNNPVRDIFDNLTWTKGRHSITFGGDWRYSSAHDLSLSNPMLQTLGIDRANGDPADAAFNSGTCAATCTGPFRGLLTTGTSTPDYNNLEYLYATLTGRLNGISGSNNFDTASKAYKQAGALVELDSQTVGGFYGQDSFRITPHLAINYGFRWQMSGAIHTPTPQYTQPTLADLYGPSTGLFQPGSLGGNANPMLYAQAYTYSSDLREPAPNVGFAWNPAMWGGKLVVRGGGAISYYDEGWEPWEQAAVFSNPGVKQTISLASNTPGASQPAGRYSAGSLTLNQASSPLLTPATYNPPFAQSTFSLKSGGTLYATDPNLKTPQVQNWNLGVQYKIGWDTVVEANYVGNHVIHEWVNYNINEINIFENGFLSEFQKAQANLTATGKITGTNTPILNAAFAGTSGATNSTFVNDVKTGQAGLLANSLATSSAYLCNLIGGARFSPCAALGYGGSTAYPINFWNANPYSNSGLGSQTSSYATLLSDPGVSNYNGLQLQVKHPVGHGLTLQANYAYSHAFTNRYPPSDTAQVNYFTLRNKRLNWGPSATDERNAFKAYGVYALPYKGHNLLEKETLGGWIASSIFTWNTGRNFRLAGGTQTYTNQDAGVILNGVDVHQLQKKAVGYYKQNGASSANNPLLLLNPAAFNPSNPSAAMVSSPSTPGQLGQIVYLTSPQYVNTDFALSKNVPIFERVHLNIQAEFLNIFNHPNFAIETTAGTNQPGEIATITAAPTTQGAISTLGTAQPNGGNRAIQLRVNLAF